MKLLKFKLTTLFLLTAILILTASGVWFFQPTYGAPRASNAISFGAPVDISGSPTVDAIAVGDFTQDGRGDFAALQRNLLQQPAPLPWSDPATWNGSVPQLGDEVMIPPGKRVLLDVDTPALASLTIHGELIFDDKDLSLTSDWIMVHGENSLLQIGTESEPFQNNATITLTGTDEGENVMGEAPLNSGTKFLMIMGGGTLELHGASRDKVSWTQLDAHANPGSTTIMVAEAVNWQAGDQIVIAPSGFNPYEAEQVTVTAVDGNQVSFAPALQYEHWGTLQTFEGKTLDQRAEVGLLTRNIRIQGAEDSVASNFGGHTMIMPNASARVEGVEFYRMGQMGHAARYPLHWHLLTRLGDGTVPTAGQYAKNNSIHHSFHRAIVIHGTNDILVERNVAYDVWSHTFVPAEDGDELNNQFLYNLGILTKKLAKEDVAFAFGGDNTERTIQSEHRPGTFWLRNPFNTVIGNHAGGSDNGFGFFYDHRFTGHQTGKAIRENPSAIVFQNNVAHSNYKKGGGNDRYPPNTRGYGFFVGNLGNYERLFDSFTSYKNFGGMWIEDTAHLVQNAMVADNAHGIIIFRGQVVDSTIIGESDNAIDRDNKPRVGTDKLGGAIHVMRQQGGEKSPMVRNVTVINEMDAAYVYLDTRAPEPDNFVRNMTLINTERPFIYYKEPDGAVIDADGSLTGTGVRTLIVSTESSMLSDECTFRSLWNAYLCTDEEGASPAPQPDAAPTPSTAEDIAIGTAQSATHGAYAIANGMSVYTFDNDGPSLSNCADDCTDTWPPLLLTADQQLSGPVEMTNKLTTITRADDTEQIAYEGQPLYFYVGDSEAGDTYGDGIGGVWHLVTVTAAPSDGTTTLPTMPETTEPELTVDPIATPDATVQQLYLPLVAE